MDTLIRIWISILGLFLNRVYLNLISYNLGFNLHLNRLQVTTISRPYLSGSRWLPHSSLKLQKILLWLKMIKVNLKKMSLNIR